MTLIYVLQSYYLSFFELIVGAYIFDSVVNSRHILKYQILIGEMTESDFEKYIMFLGGKKRANTK